MNVTLKRILWALAAFSCLAAEPTEPKLGLEVRFPSDLVMENVSPGAVINLRQIRGIPYLVRNKSSYALDVISQAVEPVGGTLREGYQAAPSPEWIKMIPGKFHLNPGETASAEVVLTVPNDPALVGQHFQLNLQSRAVGRSYLAVAVHQKVRFSIGVMGPESLKKEKSLVAFQSLDLDLSPATLRLDNVPLGETLDVRKLKGTTLKVTNRGTQTVRLRFRSVTPAINFEEGEFVPAEHPEWLTIRPENLKVKPDSVASLDLKLLIPNDPENAGRKFLFFVEAELDGVDVPLAINNRLYVTTRSPAVKEVQPK